MNKKTTIAVISVILVAVVISQVMVGVSSEIPMNIDASDGNDDNTLAETRANTVAAGKIPNDYLIDRIGEKWVEHYETRDIADDRIQWIRTFLSISTDSRVDQLSDRLSMTGINFITLTENPDIDLDEVAALQLHSTRQKEWKTP